jgi:phage terminase large subunit GpA-like protein
MNITTSSTIIKKQISLGLKALEKPAPMRLSEWAETNFYLSSESSYVEGKWETLPFQRAVMDSISNDDIREVVFMKSARVGFTKIILAAMGYFAEHKKRNQAVWQPVDDDADEFVKTEIEPMIRDIPVLQDIFPSYNKKAKGNTLRQKTFLGASLFMRGGKAAKNYRRISVDTVYLDELDGFDKDIEKEGDPVTLASKRVEGSTFPKVILGSTPKIKNDSLIEMRAQQAEKSFYFFVPCIHCGEEIEIKWGAKDSTYGMKWVDDDPNTAAHLCGECGALMTQDQYLDVYAKGRYKTRNGEWVDENGIFRNSSNEIIPTPLSVAFYIWTAYSPMTSWGQIVREFLSAKNDRGRLKTFVNTTLGETWEEDENEKIAESQLFERREHYKAIPNEAVVLTAGIDTQDDRFEIQIDAWGEGEERWSIDYIRLYGDPSRVEIWDRLAEQLRQKYKKENGEIMDLRIACQDHGGHYSDEVNKFSKRMGVRFLIPTKGSSVYGKPVVSFPRKRNSNGVYLTIIGTDTAKDLMFQRLQIMSPGMGYWHFPVSEKFDGEYFKQLTAEERVPKWVQGQKRYVWDAKGRRNEPWDCSSMSFAGVRILQQHMGLKLEKPKQETPKPQQKTVETEWVNKGDDWI